MVKHRGFNPARAILVLGVAFLLYGQLWAEESWYRAKGPVGSKERSFLVKITKEKGFFFKGGHRPAPSEIAGQTYVGYLYSLMSQGQNSDSLFWWHTQLLVRWEHGSSPVLVWQNSVRGGDDGNDWTRCFFLEGRRKVEYHSPFYGDGEHPLPEGVIPEEFLPFLAMDVLAKGQAMDVKALGSQWERPYLRKTYKVRIDATAQSLMFDEVKTRLVTLARDDQNIAEAWISVDGYQLLRYKTFQGVWLEKIQ